MNSTLDITSILKNRNLSVDEARFLLKTIDSLSKGDSTQYRELWASDYDEMPVDIYTFITDPRYLGKSWVSDDGKLLIYDYWVKVLKYLFSSEGRSKYEVAFSGAIGLGKTNIAVIGMCYILHQLLCLKDPAAYYKLRKGSSPALGFLNVTLDQSYGVGFKMFQKMCLNSEWFRARGTVLGREGNETYYPGKGIEWIVGSSNQHFIGRDIFCFTGDTLVRTRNGPLPIKYLVDHPQQVYTSRGYTKDTLRAVVSGTTDRLVHLRFSDGTVVRCTYNHRFYVSREEFSKYEYVSAIDLKSSDRFYGSHLKLLENKIVEYGGPVVVYDVVNSPTKNFQIVTKVSNLVVHNCALLDELNFRGGQADNITQSQVMKLYSAIFDRMTNRFMSYGQLPGKLFLVSSKNQEHDFLEEYIKHQVNKPQFFLVDEPVWNVIDPDKLGLSGETFRVAVGDRYSKSRILSDNEVTHEVEKRQRVIDVPVEYRDRFELDINGALNNFAGISISSSSKFFAMDKVTKACKSYLVNPFTTNVITLGFDDTTEIKDFFLPDKMSRTSISKPHHIHWDISLTGDSTGFSMMVPSGTRRVKRSVGLEMHEMQDTTVKLVFAIKIKNKPGEEIPYHKIRRFIYYLREEIGIPIASISCDSFQSRDTIQAFKLKGINSMVLSVDRSKEPYYALKNAVNEERILMPEIPELIKEFEDVQENAQKIDHTSSGSKDILDTLAANVYKISQSYTENNLSINQASTVVDMNQIYDDEEDYNDWILPEGVTVIDQSKTLKSRY